MDEPITASKCDQCGDVFQTSAQHPRRYCSISCEEGRTPLPQDDPRSDGFWLHVQGRPQSLVGSTLVASGMKFCDYSPDWHRTPDDYSNGELIWVDRDAQEMVVKRSTVIGRVDGFENNQFRVAHYDEDYCLTHYHWHDASMVVSQLRSNLWWAE
jgi:hypothetical protein